VTAHDDLIDLVVLGVVDDLARGVADRAFRLEIRIGVGRQLAGVLEDALFFLVRSLIPLVGAVSRFVSNVYLGRGTVSRSVGSRT